MKIFILHPSAFILRLSQLFGLLKHQTDTLVEVYIKQGIT